MWYIDYAYRYLQVAVLDNMSILIDLNSKGFSSYGVITGDTLFATTHCTSKKIFVEYWGRYSTTL